MLISLEWLNQYVNLDGLSPHAIAEALTNSGLEVESIEQTGGQFSGVVVGKITAVDPHPNADKLRLVTVDLKSETTQVVCGAPNVRQGLLIAFAKLGGQVLNRKDGSVFTLAAAKIRGVESCGMICSLDELGLTEQYPATEDGIWPLNGVVDESTLGQDLKEALKLESDTVLDVAPTANRGDLMSVVGVAREVAALFDRELHLPTVPHRSGGSQPNPIKIVLPDASVCQYYVGAMLAKVKMGPSPDWMVRRLQAAGVRAINNVVDITNYVMLETGQPLHAFDQLKLGLAGEVGVRRAHPEETLTTLDEVERTLSDQTVVITMNDRPVALAGVMGGYDTEIDDHSTQVFLESAYFTPVSNRRSAKSVGLRTEASARFERGVDPGACRTALLRAIDLLKDHAGAELHHISEASHLEMKDMEVGLRFKRLDTLLGIAIDHETVSRILRKLGFLLKPAKDHDRMMVAVPTFRQHDVSREIDLIEEVIRIYGYDKIPYTLPEKTVSVPRSLRRTLLNKVSRVMNGAGLQEVVSSSLIGDALLEKTGFSIDASQAVRVTNSHSEEHTLLRQSLLPNLLEIAKFNQAQGVEQVWIFELGRAYFKKGKPSVKHSGVAEKLHLSGLLLGDHHHGGWHQKAPTDFYTLKGLLENLLNEILPTAAQVQYETEKGQRHLHPGKSARLVLSSPKGQSHNVLLGYAGQLHPVLQEKLKFRQPVFVFELEMEPLYKTLKQFTRELKPLRISAYPSVKRDMAFSAPETLSHQEILNIIQAVDMSHIRHVELFDEYRGEQLGEGQRSLAYRVTLQSDDATLTDAQIDQVMSTVKKRLADSAPVQFR
jgi:phenylalanyl-tRNA synthetase beta chain